MAFNTSFENVIRSWKVEQATIHESCQLYREIIYLLTSHPRLPPGLEENVLADTSPVKKEEINLLEKALEKALQIHTGSKPFVTWPNIVKPSGTQNDQGAATEYTLTTFETKSKLVPKTTDQKDQRKCRTTVCYTRTKQADGIKSVRTNDPKITHRNVTSSKALPAHGQHAPPCGSKYQMIKTAQLCGSAVTDSGSFISFSKSVESERNCLFQQEELLKWTNLKLKENRLWDKILAFETKSSTSGRDLFMARMKSTFPMRWPCGSPGKIQAVVHRLIQQGQDLPANKQTGGVLVKQTSGDSTKRGGEDLAMKFNRLIHKCTVQVRREWESWDRWRPEWGCLCPIGTESEWHEGRPAPLPKTVTYTTDRELAELETLRMRVALLQQEAFVEKILSDTLPPHLPSAVCTTLNPSLLRDLYSVLGEGGERFPAIVLDSEPDS